MVSPSMWRQVERYCYYEIFAAFACRASDVFRLLLCKRAHHCVSGIWCKPHIFPETRRDVLAFSSTISNTLSDCGAAVANLFWINCPCAGNCGAHFCRRATTTGCCRTKCYISPVRRSSPASILAWLAPDRPESASKRRASQVLRRRRNGPANATITLRAIVEECVFLGSPAHSPTRPDARCACASKCTRPLNAGRLRRWRWSVRALAERVGY